MFKESLSKWKDLVKDEIEFKINTLRSKYVKSQTNKNMLPSGSITDPLQEEHHKFIVTPIYKANGNFALTHIN